MEINKFKFLGTITHILPLESGTSKQGKDWQKLQFVVKEEKSDYPQSMVFTMMDAKKIENFQKYEKVGNAVEVSFNLSAREYNGKFYSDVTAWSVFGAKSETKPEAKAETKQPETNNESDGLPF